jgi:hypothetical protein
MIQSLDQSGTAAEPTSVPLLRFARQPQFLSASCQRASPERFRGSGSVWDRLSGGKRRNRLAK